MRCAYAMLDVIKARPLNSEQKMFDPKIPGIFIGEMCTNKSKGFFAWIIFLELTNTVYITIYLQQRKLVDR